MTTILLALLLFVTPANAAIGEITGPVDVPPACQSYYEAGYVNGFNLATTRRERSLATPGQQGSALMVPASTARGLIAASLIVGGIMGWGLYLIITGIQATVRKRRGR